MYVLDNLTTFERYECPSIKTLWKLAQGEIRISISEGSAPDLWLLKKDGVLIWKNK